MRSCTTGPGPQNGMPMPIGGGSGGMPTMPGCEDGGASLRAQKTKAERAANAAGCDSFLLVRHAPSSRSRLDPSFISYAGVVGTAARVLVDQGSGYSWRCRPPARLGLLRTMRCTLMLPTLPPARAPLSRRVAPRLVV